MKTIKPYHLLFLAAITGFAFSSCKKLDANQPLPMIVNVLSVTGGFGDTITLRGTNLPIIGDPVITVNDKAFKITELTKTSVKAVVPKMAGSGKVTVKIHGQSYDGPNFIYQYRPIVTTLAGTGAASNHDGVGSSASFKCPWGIVADDNGDVYIADCYNRLIRKKPLMA